MNKLYDKDEICFVAFLHVFVCAYMYMHASKYIYTYAYEHTSSLAKACSKSMF